MRLACQHGLGLTYFARLYHFCQPLSSRSGLLKKGQGQQFSVCPSSQRSLSATAAFLPTETRQHSTHGDSNFEFLRERLESNGAATSSGISEKVVIGIDPDNHGAVAVVRIPEACTGVLDYLSQAEVEIHDMPLEEISVGKRIRRQTDAIAAVKIIRRIAEDTYNSAKLCAILEEPVPNPVNGLLSVLGTGFAFGVWKAVLASHYVNLETVSARRWKGDLGLNKAGKEGSRSLALQLFPKAAGLLKRKKDHGRAEALLIVAWALGLRALKPRPEEPGDIIITEGYGTTPSITVIADSTLNDDLDNGEETPDVAEMSLEPQSSSLIDLASDEQGRQT